MRSAKLTRYLASSESSRLRFHSCAAVIQVENEELVFTLEVVVDKFGDDIAPYAVNLARNLTAAFWKYSGQADGDEEADEDDQGKQL